MLLHTIIIDDDPSTLDVVELELAQNCSHDVCMLKKCLGASEGLKAIRQLKPDLIILDVEMPVHSGIEIVEILRGEGLMDFDVIFTTAHEDFSVKAFELNALHYLLKPYHTEQLIEAVRRAKTKRLPAKNSVSIEQVEAMIQQNRKAKTLRISTREGVELLRIDDIIFVQADANYATIYLVNGESRMVSCPLKDIENQLVSLSTAFQRTHQSYLVNFDFVRGFRRDGSILLRGYDVEIPVSKLFKSSMSL
jgi:two-component system, LytTR family, response regulator